MGAGSPICTHIQGLDITVSFITWNTFVLSPFVPCEATAVLRIKCQSSHETKGQLRLCHNLPPSLHTDWSRPWEPCNNSLFRHSSLIVNLSFCLNTETLRSCWQAQLYLPGWSPCYSKTMSPQNVHNPLSVLLRQTATVSNNVSRRPINSTA